VALLLLAAALRLVGLTEVPPGLRYDELLDYRMAERILAGERPIYFPESWGEEPLLLYLQALSLHLFGHSDWSLRLPAALLGVLGVLITWLAARRLAGRAVAMLTAGGMAVSFWSVFFGRLGLRLVALVPVHSLMVYLAWRGLRLKQDGAQAQPRASVAWGYILAAGLCLGAGFYVYPAARLTPLVWLLFAGYLALFHRHTLRRVWVALGSILAVGLAVAAPILVAIYGQPGTEQRVTQVAGPVHALLSGDVRPLAELALRAPGMFFIEGDHDWLYNVSGRPVFDPLTAACFLLGVALCLWRWRRPHAALLLLWLGVGTLPTVLAAPPASLSHAIAAQPPALLLMALGLASVANAIGRSRTWAGRGVAVLVLALHGALSARAYFGAWAHAPQLRGLHQVSISALARELNSARPEGPVLVGASVNYWQPWNVVGMALALRPRAGQPPPALRWFDPAGALVFPAGPVPARAYFPFAPEGRVLADPELWALFSADAEPLPADTANYEAYLVRSPRAFERRLAEASRCAIEWPADLAARSEALASHPPRLPLEFDGRLALVGAEPAVALARPGDTLRLLTYWEVRRADPAPLVAFVHLTADGHDVWGQQDWLDVWPDGLQPGDRFVQVHRVPVQAGAPAGEYHLQLGLYRPDTGERLPIAAEAASADRVWVAAVRIEP